jgi:hypothetical protein
MFAQQVFKDQNCNFSTFENSGEDLINEVSVIFAMRFFRTLFTCFLTPYFHCFLKADQLVKRVDSLHAEKRAIKMELESIRSTQPENVKC